MDSHIFLSPPPEFDAPSKIAMRRVTSPSLSTVPPQVLLSVTLTLSIFANSKQSVFQDALALIHVTTGVRFAHPVRHKTHGNGTD